MEEVAYYDVTVKLLPLHLITHYTIKTFRTVSYGGAVFYSYSPTISAEKSGVRLNSKRGQQIIMSYEHYNKVSNTEIKAKMTALSVYVELDNFDIEISLSRLDEIVSYVTLNSDGKVLYKNDKQHNFTQTLIKPVIMM